MITNYRGQLAVMGSRKLILYGKRYMIANCKIVNRDGVGYVASIQGELDSIPKIEWIYDKDTGGHILRQLFSHTNTLVIGEGINCLHKLEVVPREAAYKVLYAGIGKSLKYVNISELGSKLPNIKVLYIERLYGHIDMDSFKNIESIKIGQMDLGYNIKFRGCVRNIKFEHRPEVYTSSMFRGCYNLDMSKLFYEGLVRIDDYAFSNNQQLVDISLPKSLKTLHTTAFDGCKNIRALRINNNDLDIINHNIGWGMKGDLKLLLEDSPNAKVHCSYEFPKSILDEYVAPHVRIVRDRPRASLDNIRNREIKGEVLGIKIKHYDTVSNVKEVVGF